MQKRRLLLALLLLGCDSESTTEHLEDGGPRQDGGPLDMGPADAAVDFDVGPDAEPAGIEWTDCDALSEPPPDAPAQPAQCALVSVPLDWDQPDGPTVELWVKRVQAGFGALGQLWLLQGGPGGSAVTFEAEMTDFSNRFQGFDIYITDARGAGNSSRWSCGIPGEGFEPELVPGCLEAVKDNWGPDALDHFTTTAAAKDVLHLIDLTAEPDRKVFVFGVSYGTYWVNRILQIAPDQLDGAILDSIVDVEHPNLHRIDARHHEIGEKLMAGCGADIACAERLGEDPWAEVGTLLDRLDEGHCADLFAGDGRQIMRQLMGASVSSLLLRSAIPALVYRVRRCEPRDIEAVSHFAGLLFQETPSLGSRLFSQLLSMHVTFSELWGDDPLDAQGLVAQAEAAWMSKDIGITFGQHQAGWPVYTPDVYHGQWAETEVPMLMLNGTWDPQTPIETARRAGEVFTAPFQTFVTFPDVTHSVLSSSNVQGRGPTCGVTLLDQFLGNPRRALDLSCVDQLDQRFFTLPERFAELLFGTGDFWD